MSDPHDDTDLRRAFRELRNETLGPDRVPDFQAMMERARREGDTPVLELVPPSPLRRGRARRALWRTGWASSELLERVATLPAALAVTNAALFEQLLDTTLHGIQLIAHVEDHFDAGQVHSEISSQRQDGLQAIQRLLVV